MSVDANYKIVTRSKRKKGEGTVESSNSKKEVCEASDSLPKSSQESTKSSQRGSRIDVHIAQKLGDFTWVQCEYPKCLKWRCISKKYAEKLGDDPWYCHMNPDPARDRCEKPEEDYVAWERAAKQCGLKYVVSVLPEGALVTAKMAGYCRWPAIVCKDPVLPHHVWCDVDGDPLSYHVEYLGDTHSHGWVDNRFILLYGEKSTDTEQENKSHNYKKRKSLSCLKPSLKSTYKKQSVDSAIAEAEKLVKSTYEERVGTCQFKYDPNKQIQLPQIVNESQKPDKSKRGRCSNGNQKHATLQKRGCSQVEQGFPQLQQQWQQPKSHHKKGQALTLPTGQKRGSQRITLQSMDVNVQGCSNGFDEAHTQQPGPSRTPQHQGFSRNHASNVYDFQEPSTSQQVPLSYRQVAPSFVTGNQQVPVFKTAENNSLLEKTMEEKFIKDIQVKSGENQTLMNAVTTNDLGRENFQQDESKFEHDVRHFMASNGAKIKRLPYWQNTPIRLFQLFTAVRDRGGYEQVQGKKLWTQIYRELAGCAGSSGSVAKNYYERNLLPYELYIQGKNYKPFIHSKKDDNPDQGSKHKACGKDGEKMFSDSEESDIEDEEIQKVLAELEEYGDMCCLEAQCDKQAAVPSSSGINITYYDESTPSQKDVWEADTASEFGQADIPDESAQEVPDVGYISDDDADDEEEDDDDYVLHEMQAIEQEIDDIEEQMIQP